MSDGKGNRAPDHIEFEQPVTQCPERHYRRQQNKLAAMMFAQGITGQQTDARHLPDNRSIFRQGKLP
jgi:hypothetical protein